MDLHDVRRVAAATQLCILLDQLAVRLPQLAVAPGSTDWSKVDRQLAQVLASLAGHAGAMRHRSRRSTTASAPLSDFGNASLF
ncbi:hypothetical protein [Paraburkholderia youngii]|uniref:Uncharacterized protein n=1 Tax=Paraburkholderia youngii TaxID=2782701 RepID=A0A7Y6N539_9BURK|nr:hypothetical protein [Paraburkholderia youngii]NUY06140.1 hypothetical protein [Paraburkholderia youngii]